MKRINLFAGHFGSGKTTISVSYAIKLKKECEKVTIVDLDIVNPYFRTKDSEALLNSKGVKLISSPYANTNVDIPAIPSEVYGIIEDKSLYAVLDIGGDDRGALALGYYREAILQENNYNMFFVINKYRPLTSNPTDTIKIMREIESACGIGFTSIINNSNLGNETSKEDILGSIAYAQAIAGEVGLKIEFTTVKGELYKELVGKIENLMLLV